ncbi:MAG: hypothetical protein AAF182_02110 [Pseudomonadota bacterium]
MHEEKVVEYQSTKDTGPKLLVCAFSGKGFADEYNMSELVAEHLNLERENIDIQIVILPTKIHELESAFLDIVNKYQPNYILGLGENNLDSNEVPTNLIEIETHAQNSVIIDYDPLQINKDGPRVIEGSEGLYSDDAHQLGAYFGKFAGASACNYLFYRSLEHMQAQGLEGNAAFIHLEDPFASSRLKDSSDDYIRVIREMIRNDKEIGLSESDRESLRSFLKEAREEGWKYMQEVEQLQFIVDRAETLENIFNSLGSNWTTLGHEGLDRYRRPDRSERESYDEKAQEFASHVENWIDKIEAHLNTEQTPALTSTIDFD